MAESCWVRYKWKKIDHELIIIKAGDAFMGVILLCLLLYCLMFCMRKN